MEKLLTQYSFSDDPKNLECRNDYNIRIRSIEIKNGAGFIVALAGKIMTMPGLPRVPAAEQIDIDKDGNRIDNKQKTIDTFNILFPDYSTKATKI